MYIGDNKTIRKVKEEVELLFEKNKNSSSIMNIYNFVLAAEAILKKEVNAAIKYLKKYLSNLADLSGQEDQIRYAKTQFLIAKLYLDEEKFLDAKDILYNTKLIELIENKSLLTAERLYLLSLIAGKNSEFIEKTQFELLSESLNLIEDKSITELHHKVFFELAKYYEARGNLNKRDYYLFYAKSLISYISENIKDPQIKKLYLMAPQRKKIVEEE